MLVKLGILQTHIDFIFIGQQIYFKTNIENK